MDNTKNIVLFGAGKSATVLIDFLKDNAPEKGWHIIVADGNLQLANEKVANHNCATAVELNIENDSIKRQSLIQKADIVISLMPPHLHYLIALDCIEFNKNLLTASYIDDKTQALTTIIKEKGLLFLYEMGLDPGIDHMSAKKIIDDIQKQGGKITTFYSHCGGLVAPESDDNPWHYKISWNPRNVVMAGKAGATFLENGEEVTMQYKELFNPDFLIKMPDEDVYGFYPNRDSLSYIGLYDIQGVSNFVRTTLRHPEFCLGWQNIIDLNLTNEEKIYETNGMTIAQFFKQHFAKNGFEDWISNLVSTKLNSAKDTLERLMELMEAEEDAAEQGEQVDKNVLIVDEEGKLNDIDVEEVKISAADQVAQNMHEANISMKQLIFLGLEDDTTPINLGLCSAADVLQFILEKKLVLQPTDKDMIIMMHELEYNLNHQQRSIKSVLRVIGKDSKHTAMAKTVGLPLGIATQLILDNVIKEKGLLIPTKASIYEPVLNELKKHGISFEEFVPNIFQ